MGVRELIEVLRTEALNRLKEESRKRKEHVRFRLLMPPKGKDGTGRLEREQRLL